MAAGDEAGVATERRVRVAVPRPERGKHLVSFVEPAGQPIGPRYAFVSKSGHFATTAAQDFDWLATFPERHAAHVTRIVAEIDNALWCFRSDDACVTYGALQVGSGPQLLPCMPADAAEYVSVKIYEDHLHAASAEEEDSVAFVPERDELPPARREAYSRYYEAYADLDGHQISEWAREVLPIARPGMELTYGEVHFMPIFRLLERLAVGPEDVLVDLGSGSGRLVLAAAVGFPFLRRILGIEILRELHEAATEAKSRLLSLPLAPVDLVWGDMFVEDWSAASVVFVMSLLFTNAMMDTLEQHAERLRAGARVVTMHMSFGQGAQHADSSDSESGAEPVQFVAEEPRQPTFRPLHLRDEWPHHLVEMEMSYGEAKLYAFERLGAPMDHTTLLDTMD